jgi:predicted enzyme related to lactoylglutathione lyase
MSQLLPNPIVHLELHTGNLGRAYGFYSRMCGWRIRRLHAGHRSYHVLDWGGKLDGGIVECGVDRASWLPYVEVACADEATERAQRLGASVLLEPREGPVGWRSVVSTPAGGQIALWQPKR